MFNTKEKRNLITNKTNDEVKANKKMKYINTARECNNEIRKCYAKITRGRDLLGLKAPQLNSKAYCSRAKYANKRIRI